MPQFKGPPYEKEQLEAIIKEALTHSQGYEQDETVSNMNRAMRAYMGWPDGHETPGNSTQQSLDVRDMVNACLAQLTPMVSDRVASFVPMGQEDEEQAESESNAVNAIIEDNGGYTFFQEAIKYSLLMRNAVAKVWMDEEEDVRTLTFPVDDDLQVAYLLEDTPPNEEAELIRHEDGEAVIRFTTKNRTPRLKIIDTRNFALTRNWCEHSLQDVPFCAIRDWYRRAELVEMGFDKAEVDDLPEDKTYDQDYLTRRTANSDMFGYSKDSEMIEVYECYFLLDNTGDGKAERYRAYYCNRKLLGDLEPVHWVPIASGKAMLYPGEWMGESVWDALADVQTVKTSLLRQWLDNIRGGNNNGFGAVEGQVNLDDLTDPRPNRIVRLRSESALVPIPYNDVGPSAQMLWDLMDGVRSERAGAALDLQDAQMQVVGDTAHGVERQYSSRELMVQKFGKTFAETFVRDVYLLMHNTMRVFNNEPLQLKLSGQWQEVDPSQWPQRNDINVTVGQTAGQRNSAQQALGMFVQMAFGAMQQGLGGQLVDMSSLYNGIKDWLQLAGVDNAEDMLIDPTSPQAQQAAQQQAQKEQQTQALQMQMYQLEKQHEQLLKQMDLQQKYFSDILDADTKEADTIANIYTEAAKLASTERTAAAQNGNASNREGN